MENASDALIMAASVLIAVLVISIAVYVFNIYGTFSEQQTEELYATQIGEFNSQFTKYEGLDDIYIHDIISLANYAKNYNESNGITSTSDSGYIQVILVGKGNLENKDTNYKNQLINDSMSAKYKLNNIRYNEKTGRVNYISFKSI